MSQYLIAYQLCYYEKFIKQYFIEAYILTGIYIFTEGHSKIDTPVEGIEGPAEPPGPIDDKGDTGPKGDKTDRGLNSAAQGAKEDISSQGPSGSGDSADFSTVLLTKSISILLLTTY